MGGKLFLALLVFLPQVSADCLIGGNNVPVGGFGVENHIQFQCFNNGKLPTGCTTDTKETLVDGQIWNDNKNHIQFKCTKVTTDKYTFNPIACLTPSGTESFQPGQTKMVEGYGLFECSSDNGIYQNKLTAGCYINQQFYPNTNDDRSIYTTPDGLLKLKCYKVNEAYHMLAYACVCGSTDIVVNTTRKCNNEYFNCRFNSKDSTKADLVQLKNPSCGVYTDDKGNTAERFPHPDYWMENHKKRSCEYKNTDGSIYSRIIGCYDENDVDHGSNTVTAKDGNYFFCDWYGNYYAIDQKYWKCNENGWAADLDTDYFDPTENPKFEFQYHCTYDGDLGASKFELQGVLYNKNELLYPDDAPKTLSDGNEYKVVEDQEGSGRYILIQTNGDLIFTAKGNVGYGSLSDKETTTTAPTTTSFKVPTTTTTTEMSTKVPSTTTITEVATAVPTNTTPTEVLTTTTTTEVLTTTTNTEEPTTTTVTEVPTTTTTAEVPATTTSPNQQQSITQRPKPCNDMHSICFKLSAICIKKDIFDKECDEHVDSDEDSCEGCNTVLKANYDLVRALCPVTCNSCNETTAAIDGAASLAVEYQAFLD